MTKSALKSRSSSIKRCEQEDKLMPSTENQINASLGESRVSVLTSKQGVQDSVKNKKKVKKKLTKKKRRLETERNMNQDGNPLIGSKTEHEDEEPQLEDSPPEIFEDTKKIIKKKMRKERKMYNHLTSPFPLSSDEIAMTSKPPIEEKHAQNSTIHENGAKHENDTEHEALLEGSMISDSLVLIDRKSGKVYSATEKRLDNGERKQVGQLDSQGNAVLFQSKITVEPNRCIRYNDLASDFPYEVDPDDHCESPVEAYKDIVPLLQSYARRSRKGNSKNLSIYDPYFCDGRVARHLEALGFPEVYNRKEDCYKIWNDSSLYPKYDIFLTNPPYSGDHIEKLMQHVTGEKNKSKPWMLLMPNFVHKKDYFQNFTNSSGQVPIYLVPKKRYVYQPPPSMRAKKASSTHKKSSPFVSMWYLWGGSREATDKWLRILQQQASDRFDVARSRSGLRDLRRKFKRN